MNVEQIIINRAVALLKSAGVNYHIVARNGATTSNMAEPPKLSESARLPRRLHVYDHTGYKEKVPALAVGEVAVFEVTAEEVDSFQGTLASWANRQLGPKSAVTTRTLLPDGRYKVEIMRAK